MKSCQFFKIYKRFDKEREKLFIQQLMRKEKLKKVGLCFITGRFIKLFKMIINLFFFYFASSFAAQFSLFDIRMTQEMAKGETGKNKWLGMVNCNIYFKTNFNYLAMNITEKIFFTDKMCIFDI